jgi:predicted nuclease of restriction endonuclease-like RecB superfamily
MKNGDRVRLKTFNGTIHPVQHVNDKENYWKLVGECGLVEQDQQQNSIYANFSEQERVLVKFDKDLKIADLIAHNNITNALWVLVSDLAIIE